MQKEVFSARSGKKLAEVEFVDASKSSVDIGERYTFRVVRGFGNLWKKHFDLQDVTIKQAGAEMLIQIVAFPSEKESVGIVDIGMILPPREVTGEVKKLKQKPSSLRRVRGYFKRFSAA